MRQGLLLLLLLWIGQGLLLGARLVFGGNLPARTLIISIERWKVVTIAKPTLDVEDLEYTIPLIAALGNALIRPYEKEACSLKPRVNAEADLISVGVKFREKFYSISVRFTPEKKRMMHLFQLQSSAIALFPHLFDNQKLVRFRSYHDIKKQLENTLAYFVHEQNIDSFPPKITITLPDIIPQVQPDATLKYGMPFSTIQPEKEIASTDVALVCRLEELESLNELPSYRLGSAEWSILRT